MEVTRLPPWWPALRDGLQVCEGLMHCWNSNRYFTVLFVLTSSGCKCSVVPAGSITNISITAVVVCPEKLSIMIRFWSGRFSYFDNNQYRKQVVIFRMKYVNSIWEWINPNKELALLRTANVAVTICKPTLLLPHSSIVQSPTSMILMPVDED